MHEKRLGGLSAACDVVELVHNGCARANGCRHTGTRLGPFCSSAPGVLANPPSPKWRVEAEDGSQ
jgi:hypothetical protein